MTCLEKQKFAGKTNKKSPGFKGKTSSKQKKMQNSVLCHSIIQTYISLKNLVGCAKSPSNLTRVKNSQKNFACLKKKFFFLLLKRP